VSKIEYGLFGFIPEDISQKEVVPGDRPYASLVYVASSREYYNRSTQVSWQSTLTLGVLGLSIVGDLLDRVHTSELKQGTGNRNVAWGGIKLTKTFN